MNADSRHSRMWAEYHRESKPGVLRMIVIGVAVLVLGLSIPLHDQTTPSHEICKTKGC